jgi:hypothetical protein
MLPTRRFPLGSVLGERIKPEQTGLLVPIRRATPRRLQIRRNGSQETVYTPGVDPEVAVPDSAGTAGVKPTSRIGRIYGHPYVVLEDETDAIDGRGAFRIWPELKLRRPELIEGPFRGGVEGVGGSVVRARYSLTIRRVRTLGQWIGGMCRGKGGR